MTVEQIELRKILTQMLADAGLNKNTILDFTKEIINEKTEKALHQALHETNLESQVYTLTQQTVYDTIKQEVRTRVNNQFNQFRMGFDVTVNGLEENKFIAIIPYDQVRNVQIRNMTNPDEKTWTDSHNANIYIGTYKGDNEETVRIHAALDAGVTPEQITLIPLNNKQ